MSNTPTAFVLPNMPLPLRRVKMVCTLGPQSVDAKTVGELIVHGMDVARLNFSHGTKELHEQYARTVREQAQKLGKPIALLQDLQGPKIRIGDMAKNVVLIEGEPFTISTVPHLGTTQSASTTYESLPSLVTSGDRILLDDGALELLVEDVVENQIRTKVVSGGILRSHKGIHIPGGTGTGPILSDKDIADLEVGVKLGVDMIALSFVRHAEDVRRVRELIRSYPNFHPLLIAKIEKKEAVSSLSEILQVSDGIMVARGDLGVELGLKKVPLVQKESIAMASRMGKCVITATQMLESMIEHVSPTRAEVSDVANAVLDGTDAVMLSAETASGQNPVQAVSVMNEILCEVEQTPSFFQQIKTWSSMQIEGEIQAIAKATVAAADWLESSVIVVWDEQGDLVRLLSEDRPSPFIVALSTDQKMTQRWSLFFGVIPIVANRAFDSFTSWEEVLPLLFQDSLLQVKQKHTICVRMSRKNGVKGILEIYSDAEVAT